jgi:hypothetical protein
MSRRSGVIYGTAFALSLVTLLVSYLAFRWLLISYHEWQISNPMVFTFWADTRAIPLALLAAAIVFWLVVKRAKRNRT